VVFKNWLDDQVIEKVLVTPTDPVKLVVVFSTYPSFIKTAISLTKTQFNDFRYRLCAPKPKKIDRPERVNWKKEGF
jgi:hypothetical protein